MGDASRQVEENPPPNVDRLLAGRLHEGGDYRTIRTRGTSDWLLIYTADGAGRIQVDGSTTVTGAGSICLITPGTPHDYGTDPDVGSWRLVWAHVHPRPGWLPLLGWPEAAPGVGLLQLPDVVADRVHDALSRAGSLSRSGMRRSVLFGMNAVEEALLWCDTQNPRGDQIDARVLVALEHISTHLDHPHTVRSLAEVAGSSPSRLSHLFTAQLGISVMAHVERQRMELARELLDLSSFPIAEVARRVGYTDALYFSKRFRQATGYSPTAYRAR